MIPGSSNPLMMAAAPAGGYQVSRSLRFNSSDSAYLSRTPAVAGSQTTYTFSAWIKRSKINTDQVIFGRGNTFINFDGADKIYANHRNGATNYFRISTAVYRDPSAWCHIVWAVDTTNATAQDRARIWFNNVEITVWDQNGTIPLNHPTEMNTTAIHALGRELTYGQYGDFYLADIHFIDGQALTPSSFTEVSATTGQLIPLAYSGSFGTNGFWLKFSDNSAATAATLGKDYSGNSNNWTPNNLSVTAGAGNDSLVDTPTSYGTDTGVGGEVRGNYATLNPLDKGSGVSLANGNLDATITTSDHMVRGTMAMPASGKWYFEFTPTVISGTRSPSVGIANSTLSPTESNGYRSASAWTVSCGSNGNKQHNSTETSYASAFAANDVGMCAVDLDNGKIWWGKNGTWFASGNPATGANAAFTDVSGTVFPAVFGPDGGVNCTCVFNFGQRAFAYPLSGFKALCDTNLGAPVVAKPNTVMDVLTWSGDSVNNRKLTTNFGPDLFWAKHRNGGAFHSLNDSVRGPNAMLQSNTTSAEQVNSNGYVITFASDGVNVTNGSDINASGSTYVGWAWDAGTSTVSNTQGSITSQVRANASAGFSVVTYTGTGSTASVGHGLGVAPAFYITKRRDSSSFGNWTVYHSAVGTQALELNSTGAAFSDSTRWPSAATSTVFNIGSNGNVNTSSGTYVAYCFAPVVGYSSMGSYVGNGSSDGPFVYTGFRPRWIMIKATSISGESWVIKDSARGTYNPNEPNLYADLSIAEQTSNSPRYTDFVSNGFKLRGTDNGVNSSGTTYIYAAFAESPFQFSRAR